MKTTASAECGKGRNVLAGVLSRQAARELALLVAAVTSPALFFLLQQDHFRRSVRGRWKGWA